LGVGQVGRFAGGNPASIEDGELPCPDDREQLVPIIQEHADRIGDIGMDEVYVVKDIIDQDGELFTFFGF
jgi:hypothetical protein